MVGPLKTIACLMVIGALGIPAKPVLAEGRRTEPPRCSPSPKPLRYEVIPDDRESPHPHEGRVQLSFTIFRDGTVLDVRVENSTDDWFNDLAIRSVQRWRFTPPAHGCRGTVQLKFVTAK